MFSDLILFYRILKDEVNIELPYYITRIEPHSIEPHRLSKPMAESRDNLRYVSCIIPKIKAFKDSYFFRSMTNWNVLPFDLRNSESLDNFKTILKEHIMWLIFTSKLD